MSDVQGENPSPVTARTVLADALNNVPGWRARARQVLDIAPERQCEVCQKWYVKSSTRWSRTCGRRACTREWATRRAAARMAKMRRTPR